MICNIYYIVVCFLLIRSGSHSRVRFTRLTYSALQFLFYDFDSRWAYIHDSKREVHTVFVLFILRADTHTVAMKRKREFDVHVWVRDVSELVCVCILCGKHSVYLCILFCLLDLFCFHSFLSFFLCLAWCCWLLTAAVGVCYCCCVSYAEHFAWVARNVRTVFVLHTYTHSLHAIRCVPFYTCAILERTYTYSAAGSSHLTSFVLYFMRHGRLYFMCQWVRSNTLFTQFRI